jgi:hypothetical protein
VIDNISYELAPTKYPINPPSAIFITVPLVCVAASGFLDTNESDLLNVTVFKPVVFKS